MNATRWIAGMMLATVAGTGTASAQPWNPYYDKLPAAEAAEVSEWYRLYISRIDSGQPDAAAAAFAFTDARLNSPLFSPVSAAVRTAALATTGNASETCHTEADLALNSTSGSALGANIRSYMLEGKIKTDGGASSQSHAMSISTALVEGENVIVQWEGADLASYGLPVTDAQASGAGGGTGSGAVTNWMMLLEAEAPQIAAGQPQGSASARLLLLGNKSPSATFADDVEGFLQTIDTDTDVVVCVGLEVWFGTYGVLPVALVTSETECVLVDATTGAVAGPFAAGSAINPAALLALHPGVYTPGTSFSVIVGLSNCTILLAPTPHRTPPSNFLPDPPLPLFPPTSPNGRPGHWTNFHCDISPGHGGRTCSCTSYGTGTAPGHPLVRTQVTCRCFPDANGNCNPTPNAHPNVPPTITPGLPPGGGMTGCICTETWTY